MENPTNHLHFLSNKKLQVASGKFHGIPRSALHNYFIPCHAMPHIILDPGNEVDHTFSSKHNQLDIRAVHDGNMDALNIDRRI